MYLLEPPSTTASSTSSADSRMNSSVYSDDVLSTKSLLGDRVTFDLEKTRSSDCKVIGYVVFDASKRYASLCKNAFFLSRYRDVFDYVLSRYQPKTN